MNTDGLRHLFIDIVTNSILQQLANDQELEWKIFNAIARLEEAQVHGFVFCHETYKEQVCCEANINWHEHQALGRLLAQYTQFLECVAFFRQLTRLRRKFRQAGLSEWLKITVDRRKVQPYVKRYFELFEAQLRGGLELNETDSDRLEELAQTFQVMLPEYLVSALQFSTEKMEYEDRHWAN